MIKKIINRSVFALGTVGIIAAGAAAFTAFEAHVINVTARIENALSVDTTPIDFGTVFPQEQLDKTFGVKLSDSFLAENRVDDVEYEIRQKPKCERVAQASTDLPQFGRVTEDAQGDFECQDEANYDILPLLCPYLSKHEISEDGKETDNDKGINAFHGVTNGWNLATTMATRAFGRLAKSAQDITDTWNVDLKVPCFDNHCAQDWEAYVTGINASATPASFIQPIANEHKLFGCDLWVEVNGISQSGGGLCSDQLDLALVIDRSGSIDAGELATMKTAAHGFVNALTLSPTGPHGAQVSFSTNATLDVPLTDNATTLNNAIEALVSSGLTNLQEALDTAATELASGNDRPDGTSPDFIVLLTDGAPTAGGDAAAAATAAKNAGITIYVVGIGTDAGTSAFLQNSIASSPAHYFDATTFDQLESILQGLASCND